MSTGQRMRVQDIESARWLIGLARQERREGQLGRSARMLELAGDLRRSAARWS